MATTPREERAFFQRVLEIVTEFDLMGLEPGTPDGPPADEYTSEARAIESVLVNKGHIEFADLSAIWLKWFSDDLKDAEHSLQPFLDALNALATWSPRTPAP